MKRVLVLLLAVAMSGALLAHQPEPKPSVTPPRSPTYPVPAAQKSDPAIDQLLRDYLSAFSKGDAKALAALYTEDAIRVGMNNQVLKGRAAIEQFYVASFAGGAKPPVLTVRAQSTRMVTPDVAVTEGTYEVAGGTAGIYVNTVVRQGGQWRLASVVPVPDSGR